MATKAIVTLGCVATAVGVYYYLEQQKKEKQEAAAAASKASDAKAAKAMKAVVPEKKASPPPTFFLPEKKALFRTQSGLDKAVFCAYFKFMRREMERALLQIMQTAQLLELQMQSEGRQPMTQDAMEKMWNTQVGGAVAKITADANNKFKVTEPEIELFAKVHESDMAVKEHITKLTVLIQSPQSVLPVKVPQHFCKETMLKVCKEILELTSEAVEEEVVKAKTLGKDLKDQTNLMAINHAVQAKVESMKSAVHERYGIHDLDNHAEVIIQSALQKFQTDPDFSSRIQAMDSQQKQRMASIFDA